MIISKNEADEINSLRMTLRFASLAVISASHKGSSDLLALKAIVQEAEKALNKYLEHLANSKLNKEVIDS